MEADGAGREALLSQKPDEPGAPAAKRRRRRSGRGRGKSSGESAPE
jgi:hypothetical protein